MNSISIAGATLGLGDELKCRPPWLKDDKKLKKTLAKTPETSPPQKETWTKI